MAEEKTTIKLSVDTADLKKGIQDANRQIRLANAEFKAASAGMDNWGKSADGVEAKLKQLKSVLGSQKTILESYKAQLQKVVEEQGENSKGADELRIKIANQEAAVNKTEKEIRNYSATLEQLKTDEKNAADEAGEQGNAFDELKKKIADQESELTKLKNTYAATVLEQGKDSDAAKELSGQIDSLSNELKDNKNKMNDVEQAADELDKSLDEVSDSSEETANGGLSVFGVALGNLAADLVSNAINKLKDLAKETIEVGKSFDTAMAQVGAVSGATGDDLQSLRNKAKEMGSTTKFTATQAAEAFNYMSMAGWKTEDMISGIDGVLNLAAASGADLATTSDIVTDALTAMGYGAEDAGRLADVMAAASSNANTNVEMMGETFKYGAAVAGSYGYTMEDVALATGLMANSGIKGSQAGTALRSIMTRLATDAGASSKSLGALGTLTEELGVQFYEADGSMRPFGDVLVDMRAKWKNLTKEEQANYGKKIAGQNALSGLMALMNSTEEDFNKLNSAIKESNGTAEEMADTMLNNLGGDMTLLSSKMEGVQLAIYEKFEPALRKGVDALSGLLDAVNFIVDHSAEFTAALAAMAVAMGSYLAFATALKVMKDGWMALTIVTKAQAAAQAVLNAITLLSPWMWAVTGILALVAAFVVLWNKSESFREFWIGLWDTVKETVGTVVEAVKEKITVLVDKIKKVVSGIFDFFKNNWQTILLFLVNPFAAFFKYAYEHFEGFRKTVDTVVNTVKSVFTTMWNTLKTKAKEAWEGIKEVFSTVAEFFQKTFSNAWQKVKEVFSTGGKIFDGIKEGIVDSFKSIVNAIIRGINKIIKIPFDELNKKLNAIRSIKIGSIKPFEKLWGENPLQVPTIPELERGGILKKGQMGILEGNGAEAVVPLDKNRRWIAQTARELSGAMNQEGIAAASNVTNNYNFNQTNNSPKPLNRLEIYRMTNKQINLAKGVL